MPIDPNIYGTSRPVQQADPMQTLAQVSQIQNMQQQRIEAQQRIQLGQDELAIRQQTAEAKRKEEADKTEAEGAVAPYKLGQFTHEEILSSLANNKTMAPDVKNAAVNIINTFQKQAAEVAASEATAGKNNQEAYRLKRKSLSDLGRGIRDVFEFSPDAIDTGFEEIATTSLLEPKVLKLYHDTWINSGKDPEVGKKLVNYMIDQGAEEYTADRGDTRMSGINTPVAHGEKVPEEPAKVDFSMYLPLYARDVLKKDVNQLTAGDYTAAKTAYEKMNDTSWHGFAPVPVWTKNGLMLVAKSGANVATATPVTGVDASAAPGAPGAQIQPQAPSAIREQAVAFDRGKDVFDEIVELAKKVQRSHGVMAALTAPAERAKAKANLNNDLALFKSTLRGMSPLIARTIGHTGVLTDVDLERTESLFPDESVDDVRAGMMINEAVKIMSGQQKKLSDYAGANFGAPAAKTPETPKTETPGVDPDIQKVLDLLKQGKGPK